ncbi:MAG: phenylalanine--tRNA ligase subunit beta, partial [Acidimicrobiia bacterium]|nr:phenylalanine--tRNA ligase subunit beta [Acidimicrobiia bacterium]
MKVSLRWLSEYIDLPTKDPEELRSAFASLGHEVEGIEKLVADWSGVVIARVEEVGPHPNADKVRFCRVDAGQGLVDVVCGAWNFEQGAIVAYARPGAVLAGGFEIGSREIRGVLSHGMICSERELGLGDEHAGILVLDDSAPVGEDFADHIALPDVIFDLTITPNRPDAMSMVGMARELSAYFGVPYRTPAPVLTTHDSAPDIAVEILDPSGCGRFTARQIDGVVLGSSPLWMRTRLRAGGVRPISNIVDVTNYVMLEMGHPLHAFDAAKIRGNRLVVRRAKD